MRAHGVTIVLTTPGTANPLTYCSEGVRAALVPEVPHTFRPAAKAADTS